MKYRTPKRWRKQVYELLGFIKNIKELTYEEYKNRQQDSKNKFYNR